MQSSAKSQNAQRVGSCVACRATLSAVRPPRLLQCGHIACESCLQAKLLAAGGTGGLAGWMTFTCPVDETITRASSHSPLCDFPLDMRVFSSSLVPLTQRQSSSSSSPSAPTSTIPARSVLSRRLCTIHGRPFSGWDPSTHEMTCDLCPTNRDFPPPNVLQSKWVDKLAAIKDTALAQSQRVRAWIQTIKDSKPFLDANVKIAHNYALRSVKTDAEAVRYVMSLLQQAQLTL